MSATTRMPKTDADATWWVAWTASFSASMATGPYGAGAQCQMWSAWRRYQP